jgi:hypothetical protein
VTVIDFPELNAGKTQGLEQMENADTSEDVKSHDVTLFEPSGSGPVRQSVVEDQEPDKIPEIIREVEKLKPEHDLAELACLHELYRTFFKLGGVLSVIQAKGWFEPCTSFRDYVENELGLEYCKAEYWTSIYKALTENNVR